MTAEEFEAEIRALIKRADLSQLVVSIILEDLAEEQLAEFVDREEV